MDRKTAILLGALGMAAPASAKVITDSSVKLESQNSASAMVIYDDKGGSMGAETQISGNKTRWGAVYKLKGTQVFPVSLQFNLTSDRVFNVRVSADMNSAKACVSLGVGYEDVEPYGNIVPYGSVTWMKDRFSSPDNVGFGISASEKGKKIGGYFAARKKGLFAGYNRTHGETKFVVSRPSEDGKAVRWFGIRRKGLTYDQINFSTASEVLGGIDSWKALQDALTNPEDNPVSNDINPLRFRCRPDERGSGLNVQSSRTRRNGKTRYAGEVSANVRPDLWIGCNYDGNGRYGMAFGNTEHWRYGKGRVPESFRMDLGYNKNTKDISAGISFAKKFR